MDNLVVFDNEPFELIGKQWKPLGHSLIDYLPTEWVKIESGVHEDGVHIVGTTPKEAENLTSEEIINNIRTKIKAMRESGFRTIYLREEAFRSLLCEFLTFCNQDRRYYTEVNYIHVMEINGFHIPRFTYRAFDTFKKEEMPAMCFMQNNLYNVADTLSDIKDSQITFARQYQCEDDNKFESNILYYTAVVLEAIRHGKFIKQCEHCHRWFVTEKKADEKYCKRESPFQQGKTCAQVMKNIKERERKSNSSLARAKERARNRANSRDRFHPGTAEEYRRLKDEWESLFKSGQMSEQEYISKLDNCMKSEKKGGK